VKPRRIVITIDEIVLDEVDARARRELGDMLERELRRVFSTAAETRLRSAELARINASPITFGPAPRAPALAAGLAERIHHEVATAGAPPTRGL
jgi:hypothetical protein